jgi:SDR family mycofactocin-dependent oxidoreductase
MTERDGRVAFVTGLARGQGRAHAVRLAADGFDIIGVDVCAEVQTVRYPPATTAELAETIALVEKHDRRIVAEIADVRDLEALRAVVDRGIAELGGLDVVVANAGVVTGGRRLWELDRDQWDTVIGVNLTGTWHTIKACVPHMIAQGTGGAIILISSVAGLKGLPYLGHYAASKHGVVGLCRTLANELGEHDIRVNSVHPNGVNTPMGEDPEIGEAIQSSGNLGPIFMNALPYQAVEPDDVAAVVSFLATDAGRYLTGAQIPVELGNLNR